MFLVDPVSRCRQGGASMIEVMVALFLLAIGLLGMLSLQNASQRSNQSAMYSSVAVLLARDMANRITANDDPYITTDNGRYNDIDSKDETGSVPTCNSNCGNTQVLNVDVGIWSQYVKTQLPAGRGTVDVDANGVHQIIVMWDDQLTGADEIGCGGDPATDLTCVTLEIRL